MRAMSQEPTPANEGKGTRRVLRLSGAEYATQDTQRNHARALFFQAVVRLEPDCLSSLFREPAKAWQSLCERVENPRQFPTLTMVEAFAARERAEAACCRKVKRYKRAWEADDCPRATEADERAALAEDVCHQLTAWATQFKVPERWFLELAFLQIRYGSEDALVFDLDEAGDAFPTPKPFGFTFEPWVPTVRTRASYSHDVKHKFEKSLTSYLDGITTLTKIIARRGRKQARGRPANPRGAPAKTREKREVVAHFDWLARYQVRGESYSAISRAVGLYRMSVVGAVKDLAKAIGMDLRPETRGGRPRKQAAPTKKA